jgi:hypothetical protein
MLLALGFPGALILSWALELTPEGIKLTESAVARPRAATPLPVMTDPLAA